jgi:hypothetical protein
MFYLLLNTNTLTTCILFADDTGISSLVALSNHIFTVVYRWFIVNELTLNFDEQTSWTLQLIRNQ